MLRIRHFFPLLILILGCGEKSPEKKSFEKADLPHVEKNKPQIHLQKIDSFSGKKSALEIQLRSLGLVNLHDLDSTIVVDLKYSTKNNFIGIDVYGDFDQCYLQPEVAQKMLAAEKYLKTKFPFYSLIVFDAVRPLHIQQLMWDTLHLPPGEKIKYLSNPKNFSLHNYGAAVDLSIIDQNGIALDMGTPFDFFGEKAHPIMEQQLLSSGELTHREIGNREILREIMRKAGFFGIQTEWWHFNSCTREVAAQQYKIVE